MKKVIIRAVAVLLLVAISLTALVSCNKDVYLCEMDVEGYGTIKMRLLRYIAPKTVDNFIELAESDFYDGLTFIRAQKGFVIQGGKPADEDAAGLKPIKGEFASNGYKKNTIRHTAGVISMARTGDPNSATSQFFITTGDARASLDGDYAGFGYIDDESMAIVYKIEADMAPFGDASMGFVSDVTKQAVITDVRIVGSYNR
jgi:peptidylprolyl isomerase/peptidyl-prolyl cis-trans isomerase B (cyclophilin B)